CAREVIYYYGSTQLGRNYW
nr:immunoglobulin heavy chain junction region [Mus musculus]MBK4197837.1 immunoglobulin heavy chain junction region [Mus musculus]